MSAETLSRAAALMRERAEAVRAGADEPDMWFGPEEIIDEFMWGDQPQHGDVAADAQHIASWHPAVALAVADWLDREADVHERYVEQSIRVTSIRTAYANERAHHALDVARAYLGETA